MTLAELARWLDEQRKAAKLGSQYAGWPEEAHYFVAAAQVVQWASDQGQSTTVEGLK